MSRTAAFLAFFAATLPGWGAPVPAAAQLPEDPRLQEAVLLWERGEYDRALSAYLAVLDGADGADGGEHVAAIAALTGEPFQVTALTEDGHSITMGPTGRHVTYETVEDGRNVTKVVDPGASGSPRTVATLPGTDAALSPGGSAAYFVARESPELAAARAAADRAREAGDRDAFLAAQAETRWLEASGRELRIRDLPSGDERTIELDGWAVTDAVWAPDAEDLYLVAGRPDQPERNDLLRVGEGGARAVEVLETGRGFKAAPIPVPGGALVVWESPPARPGPLRPGVAPVRSERGLGALDLATGRTAFVTGAASPSVSADGSRLAWLGSRDGLNTVESIPLTFDELVVELPPPVVATEMDLANPAVSPDGRWVAYQKRPVHDWEIFAVPAESPGQDDELQLTWEIQHDLFPAWVGADRVLAAKGEGRHRRSFVYDLREGRDNGLKIFHNNTVRTIAPEYEWAVTPHSPDGTGGTDVVIVAERDGDTVSPERGVYVVHLDRPVTREEVRARLAGNLAAEKELRARGSRAFMPISADVRQVTERVDVGRIYEQAAVLYGFGSKYITQPGNRLAADHIAGQLRSWGYEPELQWFEPRPGLRTANVIARLPGTADPDLVYVVSSHFDSTERGPGADDNTSGTTALLEAARVMKDHPMPATIEFAFFTGEEAGLLGSREYVRRAVADGKRIVGALNNDMVGWSNGPRLDNTIRYSNPGIRDIQHAAAILFSDLITYDALYYKSTDAAAYYEEYGDIVGGIGSYPVLGNPHYHQFTDRLNTINQRLVAEVSRVTVASLMLLASSPSRLEDVRVTAGGGDAASGASVTWTPSPEGDVTGYVVVYTDRSGRVREVATEGPRVRLPDLRPGSEVAVRAVDAGGLHGWDWARAGGGSR